MTTNEFRVSRRQVLGALGALVIGGVSYALLDSQGYLGPSAPVRRYLRSYGLSSEAAKYGDDGDRVAYAVKYLGLPTSVIDQTVSSWDSLSADARAYMGGTIPTATAVIVADELSNPATAPLAQRYPSLLWIHAHSNAIFAFPWMTEVKDGDPRLIKMADLRLSEGPPTVLGHPLDLYYPESDPNDPSNYGKRRYVREAFAFFALNFGSRLDGLDPEDIGIITEQTIAESVTVQFSGPVNNLQANSGDTLVFFNTGDVPIYAYTAVDNSAAIGDQVRYGSLAVGLETMKRFRERHPDLRNSSDLPLLRQGYTQIDDLFIQDPAFSQYLYQGFYGGAFSTNPVERTFSWKEYQTVGLVPEQTVRGFGVAKIQDFHPANCQPLSMLKAAPAIVELLVQTAQVYVPSKWHLGKLFEPYGPG